MKKGLRPKDAGSLLNLISPALRPDEEGIKTQVGAGLLGRPPSGLET